MEDVKPSEELRKQTLIRMQRPVTAKPKRVWLPYVRFAALAACCVVIAVCAIVLHPNDTPLVIAPAETTTTADGDHPTTTTTVTDVQHGATLPGDQPQHTSLPLIETDINGTGTHYVTVPPDTPVISGLHTLPPDSGTSYPGTSYTGTQHSDIPHSDTPVPGTTSPWMTTHSGGAYTTAVTAPQTVPSMTTVSFSPHTTAMTNTYTTGAGGTYATTSAGTNSGGPLTPGETTSSVTDSDASADTVLLTTTWKTQTVSFTNAIDFQINNEPSSWLSQEEATLQSLSSFYNLSLSDTLGGIRVAKAPHHRYFGESYDYGTCVQYGDMSDYTDRTVPGAVISARLDMMPLFGPEMTLSSTYQVEIEDCYYSFGICMPVFRRDGTLEERQIFCAKIECYDPIYATTTYATVVVKGVTLDTFLRFMSELTT